MRPPRNWMSSLPPTTFGFRSRKDWMSRLLRGRSRSCCSSRPAAIGRALQRDVVDGLGRDRDRLVHAAELELRRRRSAVPDARRTTPGLLELLEAGGHDLDAVGARAAGSTPRSVPRRRSRRVRGTPVASSVIRTARLGHRAALGVGDRAADRARGTTGPGPGPRSPRPGVPEAPGAGAGPTAPRARLRTRRSRISSSSASRRSPGWLGPTGIASSGVRGVELSNGASAIESKRQLE